MDKNHAKMDKVSCAILAAFILMSGTHFSCRYDVGALVDTMFQKVSAETYLPEASPTTQVALAAPTANDSSEEPLTTVTKSIARNPFAVPAGAMPVRTTYVPADVNGSNTNMNNNTSFQPKVPAAPSAPVLQGIVQSGSKSMAIIEYMGTSKAYSLGQEVGGYTLESIGARSVSLGGEQISIGGNG